jgi:RNA polymerase sigma-70 factor (ECF subfamily)
LGTEQQSIYIYLIQRCKKGDRLAQNELYRHFVGAMYNICRRMMGNDDDAQDMLQDSFIDAFSKLNKLQSPETFPAWLKRIVVNNCINELRKRKNIFLGLEEDVDFEDAPEIENEYANTKAKKILSAMDKISEGCKVVANLYLFDGYDHKEIAQILSITESASKAQYSKAKAKIRNILEIESK